MQIQITNILIFYDIPQLCTAQDSAKNKYLCVWVKDDEYILMPISDEKLYKIVSGKLDLREAFENSELWFWYRGILDDFDTLSFDPTNILSALDESELPGAGCYFPENAHSDDEAVIIQRAQDRQKIMLDLSISDENDSTSIPVNYLSDFIDKFQSVVRYAYKKIVSRSSAIQRWDIDKDVYSTLFANGASVWSFKLHIELENFLSISESPAEMALGIIDKMFTEDYSEEELVNEFRNNKWHLLNSVKNLLDTVREEKMQFKYIWSGLWNPVVHKRNLSRDRIVYLSDLLWTKEDLMQEIKELTWVVQAIDVKWEWRILNTEDEQEYKWTFPEGFTEEVIVKWRPYKFICEERIEGYKVSQKEKVTYKLIDYKPID
jgi:hypothetical protein